MPRGRPKRPTAIRLDPELLDAVLALTDNLTAAVEEGLRLWLRRAERTGQKRPATQPKKK